jgi:hypothetical protein
LVFLCFVVKVNGFRYFGNENLEHCTRQGVSNQLRLLAKKRRVK